MNKKAIFLALCAAAACALYGQEAPGRGPEKRAVDDMIFKVAVFGPSDEIFVWWGHAALLVENTRWGYSRIYDWGIFSYPGNNFLWDFLRGRVRYKCTVDILDMTAYLDEDRDVTVYTLDLDAEGKEAILNYAQNNVLPKNCYYDYHEFRDNCATRIRDLIDLGTGGQLKERLAAAPGRFTLRQHIRRFTWFRPFSGRLLDFLMGQNLDEPVTVWNEMFLPVEIGRSIADFRYTGNSGAGRNLVSSVEILNASKNRPPVLNAPPRQWPQDLMLAAVFAAAILYFRALCGNLPGGKRAAAARIVRGAAQSVLGLLFGAAGCALAYGLFFMKNDYIQQNVNIVFINPLLLAAFPLGILAAAGKHPLRREPEKYLRLLWKAVFVTGSATLFIRILPWFFQQNQPVQALVLPLACMLGFPGSPARRSFTVRPPGPLRRE